MRRPASRTTRCSGSRGVPNVFASPVAAAGKVIVLGRDGTAAVIKHGTAYEVLGTNTLDDQFDASPALAEREIYLRGTSTCTASGTGRCRRPNADAARFSIRPVGIRHLGLSPGRVVVRRRRVELPAVLVALGDLVGGLQLLVVLVGDAERLADVVDAVLIGRRVVAAGGFVADGVGVFPVRVDVPAGQRRAAFRCALRSSSCSGWRPERAAEALRSRSRLEGGARRPPPRLRAAAGARARDLGVPGVAGAGRRCRWSGGSASDWCGP